MCAAAATNPFTVQIPTRACSLGCSSRIDAYVYSSTALKSSPTPRTQWTGCRGNFSTAQFMCSFSRAADVSGTPNQCSKTTHPLHYSYRKLVGARRCASPRRSGERQRGTPGRGGGGPRTSDADVENAALWLRTEDVWTHAMHVVMQTARHLVLSPRTRTRTGLHHGRTLLNRLNRSGYVPRWSVACSIVGRKKQRRAACRFLEL